MKKNLFLTFCFSVIPGAGQMYQEYMKRGLSILILFFTVIGISMLVGSPIFALPIPIILIYSFFDTWNIRNMSEEKRKEREDELIWNDFELKSNFKLNKNINTIFGIILILAGIYILGNTVFLNFAYRFGFSWLGSIIDALLRYVPTIIVAVIAMYAGFKLIMAKKNQD